MKFSDTTNKNGVIQMIEQTTGLGDAGVTGNAINFAYFTSLVNQWRRIMAYYAWKSDKSWAFDDANHTTFTTVTTTIEDSQRDYTMPTTALRIKQVEVKDLSGNYYSLAFMDENDTRLHNEKEQEDKGLPSHYRLVGRSVILYPKPDTAAVTASAGLRLTVDREIDELTVSDTSQEMGFDKAFEPIMYYGPCYEWASVRNVPPVANLCKSMIGNFPGLIDMFRDFYANRNQDVVPALSRKTFRRMR